MQDKKLLIIVAALSAVVLCWGIWAMLKPPATGQPADSHQDVLMKHIEYISEVHHAHEDYAVQFHNDTSAVLIYRYSPDMCAPCYQEDIYSLRVFQESIGRDVVLALPAYPVYDRISRARIINETEGFKHRNITADSLAIPVSSRYGALNYFAVLDTQGRIGMVFFPVRGRPELTQRYFREVLRYFQADENDNP